MRILIRFDDRILPKYKKFNIKYTPEIIYEVSLTYKHCVNSWSFYCSIIDAEDIAWASPGDGDMSIGIKGRIRKRYWPAECIEFISDDNQTIEDILKESYLNHERNVVEFKYKKINMHRWCKKYYDMKLQFDNNMTLACNENAENANTEEIKIPDIKHLDELMTVDEIHMLGYALYMNSPLAALEFLQNRLHINKKQFALYSDVMTDMTYLLFTVPEEVKWDTMKFVKDLFFKFNIIEPDSRHNMDCYLNHGKSNENLKTHTYIYEIDHKQNTPWWDERWGNYDFITKIGETLRVTRSAEDPNMLNLWFDDERWKEHISLLQHMFIKGIDDLLWENVEHISITPADIELYKQKIFRECNLSIDYIPKVYPRDYIIKLNKEG